MGNTQRLIFAFDNKSLYTDDKGRSTWLVKNGDHEIKNPVKVKTSKGFNKKDLENPNIYFLRSVYQSGHIKGIYTGQDANNNHCVNVNGEKYTLGRYTTRYEITAAGDYTQMFNYVVYIVNYYY